MGFFQYRGQPLMLITSDSFRIRFFTYFFFFFFQRPSRTALQIHSIFFLRGSPYFVLLFFFLNFIVETSRSPVSTVLVIYLLRRYVRRRVVIEDHMTMKIILSHNIKESLYRDFYQDSEIQNIFARLFREIFKKNCIVRKAYQTFLIHS